MYIPKNSKTKVSHNLMIKVQVPDHEQRLALLIFLSPVSEKSMCPYTSASLTSTPIPHIPSQDTGKDILADTAELFEIPYTEVFKMFYTKVKSIHSALQRHCKLAGQHCQGKK